MKLKHSFFICDEDNCTDKEKMIGKLAQKIQKDLECIFCDYYKHKNFKTFQDVQNHMTSLGHCMMNQDYLHDYDDFYDYSEENMKIIQKYIINENDVKGQKNVVGFKVEHKDKTEGEKIEEEDEEWIELSEDETEKGQKRFKKRRDGEKDENGNVILDGNLIDPKKKHNLRQFFVKKVTINHLGELVLPNNKVLGNRKYKIYYNQRYRENYLEKQNLIKALQSRKVVSSSTDLVLRADITELRNLYNKTIAAEDQEKFKKFKKFEESREKISQEYRRIWSKRQIKMNIVHNRVLSTHYRDRNLCI